MHRARLAGYLCAACLACGARTPLSADPLAGSDAATAAETAPPTVTLSIPLGTYEACTSSTVTTRPNFVGGTGRGGAITLSQRGDGVVATFAFPTYASGSLVFAPTAATSAAFRAGQTFDVQTANPSFGVVTVTATTGALSLVGPTLFISTHGVAGADDVSTFFRCRVPAGLRATDVVTNAPPPAPLAAGVYRACTAASSTEGPVLAGVSAGGGSLTVSQVGASLRLTWSDSLLSELACGRLDFGADPVTAVLTAGQTCEFRQPCGPPPTLGTSPYPSTATLTDLRGSMMVNGNALFVDLRGDASAEACGIHDLSITCAGP
ncbi:MAG: hypothetical protein JWM10_261 [Myxococcaceae bacterium]|nr:hypothetical protein [Myxococcaceae bacterium]